MVSEPGYLMDWCLTEKADVLLLNKPDVVDSFRALSDRCLNRNPELREAMVRRKIWPPDSLIRLAS